jgi:hypothetical protein
MMNFIKPKIQETFQITGTPTWPSIVFQTDATGSHTWKWTISWHHFTKSGTASTTGNQWDAKDDITNLGGTLTVHATAGTNSATISVNVLGENPTPQQVKAYKASDSNKAIFDKILEHESHFRQFQIKGKHKGEPVLSFDNGYGMTQITPARTIEQVWNWQTNVDSGLDLFVKDKIQAAKHHLSQHNRKYTNSQLMYEAVSRYNGGSYHVWDTTKGWVRNPHILCDTKTGNIGWDMTDPANAGKTEAALHTRDATAYQTHTRGAAHRWKYTGVCHADRILGPPPAPAPAPPQPPALPLTRLWFNLDGDLVHPGAPAGGGGPRYFCDARQLSTSPLFADDLPHPHSPAARYLDPLELGKHKNKTTTEPS